MRKMLIYAIGGVIFCMLTGQVRANPVNVNYVDIVGQCRDRPNITLNEEFGPPANFDANERFGITVLQDNNLQTDCAGRGVPGGNNDYLIQLTNSTGMVVLDLFITADSTGPDGMPVNFANFDGTILGNEAKFIIERLEPNQQTSFVLMDSTHLPTFNSQGVNSANINSTYSIVGNFVPEPTTMLLLGTGLAGIGAMVRKRRKAKGE